MKEKDFFIIVFPDSSKDNFDTVCWTKEYLKNIISDGNNIFYECNGKFIDNTNDKEMKNFGDIAYVNIVGLGGVRMYLPIDDIQYVLAEHIVKVFYAYYVKNITHTVSWTNIYDIPNYVSSNHCQNNTNIQVYTLKICEGDCVISNMYK
jgi:hypothetical protein